jgi:putative transposase
MGSTGDAYDNTKAESFFARLEAEPPDRTSFRTRADARLAVFDYIDAFNPTRRHSALAYFRRPSSRGGTVPNRSPLPNR